MIYIRMIPLINKYVWFIGAVIDKIRWLGLKWRGMWADMDVSAVI